MPNNIDRFRRIVLGMTVAYEARKVEHQDFNGLGKSNATFHHLALSGEETRSDPAYVELRMQVVVT